MNKKDLLRIAIAKNEIAKHCCEANRNFSSNQTKGFDKENRLISRKTKETIHSLKNSNHIYKNSYTYPEIRLPNIK